MHVRTIFYVLSKVQSLFNLRRIRKATILYQEQSPQDKNNMTRLA